MKIVKIYSGYVLMLLSISWLLLSCNKFLDEKPLKTQVVPSSFADLQALLDFHVKMNEWSPILNDLASDDYYISSESYWSLSENERLNYIWDKSATFPNSWVYPYQNPIYYANVVLSQIDKITGTEEPRMQYNTIKGSALFYRAFNFERLAQLYCRPYSNTASTDEGIVLRLTTEIEAPSKRATVEQTYVQITDDLKTAAHLLPANTSFPTRPNKAAAYGALARTYLSMRDYKNAGIYADLCLQQYNILIDYNTLIPLKNPPVSRFNAETIFYNHADFATILDNTIAIIDSNLYMSYADNDLRKQVFFKSTTPGNYGFQGCYDGTYYPSVCFDGITTDEMYLIRAECFARTGKTTAALNDLNSLLEKRWVTGTFTKYAAANSSEALEIILTERRKELVYRGLRWSDLRRLNIEGANITLKRIIDGTTYTLPPNDPRWVMLIPEETTNYSNISQNPR